MIGDLSFLEDDGTLWCRKLQRKYEDGALVAVAVGNEIAADSMRWGYVLEQRDRMVKVRLTSYTSSSHPLGPLGELDE